MLPPATDEALVLVIHCAQHGYKEYATYDVFGINFSRKWVISWLSCYLKDLMKFPIARLGSYFLVFWICKSCEWFFFFLFVFLKTFGSHVLGIGFLVIYSGISSSIHLLMRRGTSYGWPGCVLFFWFCRGSGKTSSWHQVSLGLFLANLNVDLLLLWFGPLLDIVYLLGLRFWRLF